MSTTEGVQQLQTFLDVNKRSSKGSSSTGGGFLKTIGNRVLGRAYSEKLSLLPDEGYKNIGDVFDFEGHAGASVNNVNEYRTMSINRYQQYATYDCMSDDTVISSALDMYADDATQTDSKGDRIWIESKDAECQTVVENVLNAFGIKTDIWKIARTLAHYGDVYIELFYDKKNGKSLVKLNENVAHARILDSTSVITEVDKLIHSRSEGYVIDRVQIVPDIENMFDLQVNGKTVAFARIPSDQSIVDEKMGYLSPNSTANGIQYYPPDKFIHFYLDQSDRRNREYFVADLDGGAKFRFEIVRGKSMIHDVFRVQRSLELLENTILLNRVSKSSLFRFVKVEVGQMSKTNVDVTLRKIKNLIESKLTLNTTSGTYKPYADPGPIENFLYIPTRAGQGDIAVESVGGDVNIRDIADIDYYNNKLFAGLKIPKSFLNFEDTLSSFGGGGALTKQDERYARTIKRLQSFIIAGFTQFLETVMENRGLKKYIGTFEVKMVQPYTSEDASRDEMFSTKLEMVKSFVDTVNGIAQGNDGIQIDNKALIAYIADEIFGDANIKKMLIITKAKGSTEGAEELGSGIVGGGLGDEMPGGIGGEESEEEPGEFEGNLGDTDLGPGIEPGEDQEGLSPEDFKGEWKDLA